MRIFALSGIHVDYKENAQWPSKLSAIDYLEDVLILAGDVTDNLPLLEHCFESLSPKFKRVLFVPGNHDLWVRKSNFSTSFDKFEKICEIARKHNICVDAYHIDSLSLVPLLGWYDFSFGQPDEQLNNAWMDFTACKWPEDLSIPEVARTFVEKNNALLNTCNQTVISFSHFLPRIDLMPSYIPESFRYLNPILGSALIEEQIRELSPQIHVYGHSHVNRQVDIDGIRYVNNAFGYPSEERITSKKLKCIYEQ